MNTAFRASAAMLTAICLVIGSSDFGGCYCAVRVQLVSIWTQAFGAPALFDRRAGAGKRRGKKTPISPALADAGVDTNLAKPLLIADDLAGIPARWPEIAKCFSKQKGICAAVRRLAKPMLIADDLGEISPRWPEIAKCFQSKKGYARRAPPRQADVAG